MIASARAGPIPFSGSSSALLAVLMSISWPAGAVPVVAGLAAGVAAGAVLGAIWPCEKAGAAARIGNARPSIKVCMRMTTSLG
jgi:hypothetical protein